MINLKNHFPHPLLCEEKDDYLKSEFLTTIQMTEESKEQGFYILNAKIFTNNHELLKLVEENKAKFTLVIECSSTHYYSSSSFKELEYVVRLDPSLVDGMVTVNTFLATTQEIKDYTSNDFHEDFQGITFDIETGEFLAAHRTGYFLDQKDVEKDAEVMSVFAFQKREDWKNGYNFELTEDKVVVYLSEEDFNRVYNIQQSGVPDVDKLIHSLYVVSILSSIFSTMLVDENFIAENISSKWMISILKQLETKLGIKQEYIVSEIKNRTPIWLAQEMLDLPMTSSLKAIENFSEKGE